MKFLFKFFAIKKLFLSLVAMLALEMQILPTFADASNLTLCADSVTFKKRLAMSIKKLQNREKLYNKESDQYLALAKEVERTKAKFDKIEKNSLLCGNDGLPRIIVNGQLSRAREFLIPGILFLYITGWIGWVGRKYISYAQTTDNPLESEIIIDIPIALAIMAAGFSWPVSAIQEFKTGELFAKDNEITISPR